MNKFLKKMGTVALAATLGVSAISAVGCAPKVVIDPTVEDTENLWIYAVGLGYGTDFVYALADEFEKNNPGVTVHVTDTAVSTTVANSLNLGPKYNDYDIYFQMSTGRATHNTYKNKWNEYPNGVLDLTSIFGKTIPGENTSIKEKMIDSYYQYTNLGTAENPKHYSLSFVTGTIGMNYNIDVMKELFGDDYEEKLPLTSEHFMEICEEIKNAPGGYTPLTYPAQIDHMQSTLFDIWWAQYEGVENYERFFKGEAWDEISESYVSPSKAVYYQEGRKKSLQAMAALMDVDKGYVDKNATDYGANNFRSLQTRFLTKEMKYVFYPCGDWLENESADEESSEFGRMKSPVISSIIDRLDTVNSEAELREVIRYVDGDTTEIDSKYSAADIAAIDEARRVCYGQHGFGHTVVVPEYTNAKTLVEKFLLYMASEEGIDVFKKNCKGGFLPFEHDYSNVTLSTFEKTVWAQHQDMIVVGNLPISELMTDGGMKYVQNPTIGTLDALFSAKKTSNYYRTWEQVYNSMIPTDAEWENTLMAAGLN